MTRLDYRLDTGAEDRDGRGDGVAARARGGVFRAYRDLYVGRDDDRLSLYLVLTTDPYPDGEKVVMVYGLYVGDPARPRRSWRRSDPPRSRCSTGSARRRTSTSRRMLGEEIPYGMQSKWRGGYFTRRRVRRRRVRAPWSTGSSASRRATRWDASTCSAAAPSPGCRRTRRPSSIGTRCSTSRSSRSGNATTRPTPTWRGPTTWPPSLRPYLSGEVYQNYADEDLVDWPAAYYGANYPRLQQVKRGIRPDRLLPAPAEHQAGLTIVRSDAGPDFVIPVQRGSALRIETDEVRSSSDLASRNAAGAGPSAVACAKTAERN